MTSKSKTDGRVAIPAEICDHSNVVKLFEFYEDDKNIYLIEELVNGKNLFKTIFEKKNEDFNNNNLATVMKQMLSTVNYLHSKKIVHRSLSPATVLLEPEHGLD